MSHSIVIDFDELESHARRVLASVESMGRPVDLAASVGIDPGSFGVLCAPLGTAIGLVSRRATSMLEAAAGAERRIAEQVDGMRNDYLRVEEAAAVALDQLEANRPGLHSPAIVPGPAHQGSHIRGGLVADPRDVTTEFTGAGLLDDLDSLRAARAARDGWGELFAEIGTDIDAAAAVIDPVGALLGMGFGWMLEHFEPVAGLLRDLTGDPARVGGWADTWHRIASLLASDIDELRAQQRHLADMSGAGVIAYQGLQGQLLLHLEAAVIWADDFATAMDIAAGFVQLVHDAVRDLLAAAMGSLVVWATEELITLGLATPEVVAQVAARAAALLARASGLVAKLLRIVGEVVDPLIRMADRFDALTVVLRRVAQRDPASVNPLPKVAAALRDGRLTSAEPGSGTGAEFGDEDLLKDHASRHMSDFGAKSAEEYVEQAGDFLTGPLGPDTMEMTRTTGDRVRFNAVTDEFGIISADGVIRTYFRPDPPRKRMSNLNYFLKEGAK